jgi:hypothetical protein
MECVSESIPDMHTFQMEVLYNNHRQGARLLGPTSCKCRAPELSATLCPVVKPQFHGNAFLPTESSLYLVMLPSRLPPSEQWYYRLRRLIRVQDLPPKRTFKAKQLSFLGVGDIFLPYFSAMWIPLRSTVPNLSSPPPAFAVSSSLQSPVSRLGSPWGCVTYHTLQVERSTFRHSSDVSNTGVTDNSLSCHSSCAFSAGTSPIALSPRPYLTGIRKLSLFSDINCLGFFRSFAIFIEITSMNCLSLLLTWHGTLLVAKQQAFLWFNTITAILSG